MSTIFAAVKDGRTDFLGKKLFKTVSISLTKHLSQSNKLIEVHKLYLNGSVLPGYLITYVTREKLYHFNRSEYLAFYIKL